MRKSLRSKIISACCGISFLFSVSAGMAAPVTNPSEQERPPIVLRTMGSLLFGGTVTHRENGETFHGDHGYAQYYVPQDARSYPIIMWHGIGQSGRSFESTPDGREGYQSILPRDGWPVYIIDQPRRGRAGYTNAEKGTSEKVPTVLRESSVWDAFRNGVWDFPKPATVFRNSQFPLSPYAVDQFFRQQTVDTGNDPGEDPAYRAYIGETMTRLLDQTGPAILMTHSYSGQFGWATGIAAKEGQLKAIVAYEPGQFCFPEGERPADIPARAEYVDEAMLPQMVPQEDFEKLTKFPIIVIYGDNISKTPSPIFNVDLWRVASARARQFVDAVNRHGGDAQLLFLPQIGLEGNTHAPFADKNNLEVAAHLEAWLHDKGLDGNDEPHQGPQREAPAEYTIPLAPEK